VLAQFGPPSETISALDEAKTPQARAETDRLHEAVAAAEIELVDVEPATLRGATELVRYVENHDRRRTLWPDLLDGEPDDAQPRPWAFYFHQSLANALAKIAVPS
jgi:hypothetical protein